jgi:GNAT superfamily N-acetyltransferase
MPLYQIEPFDNQTHSGPFESGDPAVDRYFDRIARWAENTGDARVYVLTYASGIVAAFYTLSATALDYEGAPPELQKGAAKRPIPAILLGRLAVDKDHQGAGLGRLLVEDAMRRASIAARSVGVRALVVDAKDDRARAWYLRLGGFSESGPQSLRLLLPVQAIAETRQSSRTGAAPGEMIRGRLLAEWEDGRSTSESMWLEVSGEDTFIVRNIPALVGQVAFADVVRITADDSLLNIVTEVVARGGYANIHLSFAADAGPADRHDLLTRWSLDWGVIYEGFAGGFGGAAVPWRHFDVLHEDVERGAASPLVRTFDVTCGVGAPPVVFPSIVMPARNDARRSGRRR